MPRALLAHLLLHLNKHVPPWVLEDALWETTENRPAKGATEQMKLLRQVFRDAFGDDSCLPRLTTSYMIKVEPGRVDHQRFLQHLESARDATEPVLAAEAARAALGEWRGTKALLALDPKPWIEAWQQRLSMQRNEAWQLLVQARLRLGHHHQLATEIKDARDEWPEDEALVHSELLALYRSGKRIEALKAYSGFRTHISTEFDLEPGRALQALRQQILDDDQRLHVLEHDDPDKHKGVVLNQKPLVEAVDEEQVVEQAIAVHLFAHAGGDDADLAWRSVVEIWARCHDSGMSAPVEGLGIPAGLPRERPRRSGIVAVCQNPDQRLQAVVRLVHNVFAISLLVKEEQVRWADLEPLASALTGEPPVPGVFDGVWLYLGKVSDPSTAAWALDDLPHAQTAESSAVALSPGVRAWQLGVSPRARRLLVLGLAAQRKELGGWTWSDGTPAMPSLARYLMHTAKMRYQMRVHDDYEGFDALCDEAQSIIDKIGGSGSAGPRTVRELAGVTMKLTKMLSRLREMRSTVKIAMDNAMNAIGDDVVNGWIADDRAAARDLGQQLSDKVDYAENLLTGVKEFGRIVLS